MKTTQFVFFEVFFFGENRCALSKFVCRKIEVKVRVAIGMFIEFYAAVALLC